MADLDLIWEDPHGLAVNKPAGLLTHQARLGSDELTLEAMVRSYLRPADPGSVYVGTVHRLDRPVSGVILWAKTPKAAHRWATQFAMRQSRKEYWAIVESDQANAARQVGTWDDWLSSPDRSGQSRVVPAGTPGSVQGITQVETGLASKIVTDGRFAWFKLFPETGRTHQLRAQAAARGISIVGDSTYGSTCAFEAGIALHARALTVEHPARHESMTLTAELPTSWSRWLSEA